MGFVEETLAKSAFFQNMTQDEIHSVIHCLSGRTKEYQKDEVIFSRNEQIKKIGIVLSGSVLVVHQDVWGNRNIHGICGVGDLFGEVQALEKDSLPDIDVVANEKCVVELLDISRVVSVCTSSCVHHQQVLRNLLMALAGKAHSAHVRMTHINRRTTREKLLAYLSDEAQRQQSLVFNIPFDRQQLADYLGVDRAAMSTELSRLQKDGVIEFNKNHFILRVKENG